MVDRGFGSNAQYLAAKRFKESLSTKFSSDVFADDVEDEHEVLLLLSVSLVSFASLSFGRRLSPPRRRRLHHRLVLLFVGRRTRVVSVVVQFSSRVSSSTR
jgi:hypothetical protein